jgi:hypothetical protein
MKAQGKGASEIGKALKAVYRVLESRLIRTVRRTIKDVASSRAVQSMHSHRHNPDRKNAHCHRRTDQDHYEFAVVAHDAALPGGSSWRDPSPDAGAGATVCLTG